MKRFLKILRLVMMILIGIAVYFGTSWWLLQGVDDGPALVPNMSEAPIDALIPLIEGGILPIDEEGPVLLEDYPIYEEGVLYIPVAFVQSYFNEDFYWDSQEKVLTYTTVNDVIRMRTDDLTYYINDEPLSLQIPIRELKDGVPYMPLEFLKKFAHHEFSFYMNVNTLVIKSKASDHDYTTSMPKDNAYSIVRTWKDSKSPIVKKVPEGQMMTVLGEDAIWMTVRTEEGLEGYVIKTDVGQIIAEEGIPQVREVYDYSTRPVFDGGLNLAWHQVSNVTANKYLDDKLENVKGLDVISPTWFHIKDAQGNVTNIADLNYVRKAHSKGIQVWALFSNQFDKTLTHDTLSSTESRTNLIKELLALSAIYELDGINVDFENVAKEDGVHFVQFMKELTPYLKRQGLVVSVDMYVPSAWTAHYGRDEVGEIVDYVMIMAYDEHWSTSPDSGSVASMPFVEKGVVDTLKEVPADKTVLGLPYYTRIWTDDAASGQQTDRPKAYSMDKAYELMSEAGAGFEWLEDIGQYYAEYQKDGIVYKLWHEEERSIEEKVKLLDKYDLAGVAGWKIGLEKKEIWDVLADYLD